MLDTADRQLCSSDKSAGLDESSGVAEPRPVESGDAASNQESWRNLRLQDKKEAGLYADEEEYDDEEEISMAAPTLTTSGYMTNSSLSSCFSEMRASNTQDSLGQLRTQRRWEAGLVGRGTDEAADGDGDGEEETEAATSERAQWRALEQRLSDLAKSAAAAEELQRRKHPRRHRPPREQTERERVLRALSSCCSEEENPESRFESAAAASFGPPSWSCGGDRGDGCSTGMELCFRNDAASEEEEEEDGIKEEFGERGQQQWQRFRRPPKNFVPSVATEFLRQCSASPTDATKLHSPQLTRPMQLCFISDPTTSDEDETADTIGSAASCSSSSEEPPPQPTPQPPVRASRRPLEPELLASLGLAPPASSSSCSTGDHSAINVAKDAVAAASAANGDSVDDGVGSIRRRQVELQAEARVALAQVEPMARMQLEVERHGRDRRCRDALAELLGVTPSRRLGASCLGQLSLGALQLAHNSLLARIEGHNSELVRCLMERDDLHMEQDAMLVEIEDLTRRAHEAETAATAGVTAKSAAVDTVVGSDASTSRAATPVRRRMSQLTARLRPNKLVSLFTGT